MDRSQATYDSYEAVRVELPNGQTLECRPLTVKEGVHFLRLLSEAENSDPDAQWTFLEEFPTLVGVEDVVMTPVEVFELGRRFLRRPSWKSPTETVEEKERAENESQSSMPDSTT